jgi:hypothetical protein
MSLILAAPFDTVQHIKVETKYFPYWQLEIEDGDHLRIDEQGWE